jgi:hypothetical protein
LNSSPSVGDNYLYIGPNKNDLSQPHIRYVKTETGGALDVKVDSLAITGTIGG